MQERMTLLAGLVCLIFNAASLSGQSNAAGIADLGSDPALDGGGYRVMVSPTGTVIFYCGCTQVGERLWLDSETLTTTIDLNQSLDLTAIQGQGGTFSDTHWSITHDE